MVHAFTPLSQLLGKLPSFGIRVVEMDNDVDSQVGEAQRRFPADAFGGPGD